MKVAVVGGGWAGIAAAVEATRSGHRITLFEAASRLGGRARTVTLESGPAVDNGQHILIGAYRQTLSMMQTLGIDLDGALLRSPLRLAYPDGSGLKMGSGAPAFSFAKAVIGYAGWSWRSRLGLLCTAASWRMSGFMCPDATTVFEATRHLSAEVRADFIDPLCIAALNTPAGQASARVFLRVLRDALFSGTGSADLLLPRLGLSSLLPEPAQRWLNDHGAQLRLSTRVLAIEPRDRGWAVDGEDFDGVILASTATEAARLARPVAPDWARLAAALDYEPIVTVYVDAHGVRLSEAILALRSDSQSPAQFIFDHGHLSGRAGLLALVVSGAARWVDMGLGATAEAALAQLRRQLPIAAEKRLTVLQTIAEKRATFLCVPGLERPAAAIADTFFAAGDYIDGPYPATLEGAVRSGRFAAGSLAEVFDR